MPELGPGARRLSAPADCRHALRSRRIQLASKPPTLSRAPRCFSASRALARRGQESPRWLSVAPSFPRVGANATNLAIERPRVARRNRSAPLVGHSAGQTTSAQPSERWLGPVPVDRLKFVSFTIAGLLGALGGLLLTARLESSEVSIGAGYELDVIAAARPI
jgi:hypothetical protein